MGEMGWNENKDRLGRQALDRENCTIRHGRDGLERKQRQTRKTSTRQKELQYKTWARWVGTKTKTRKTKTSTRQTKSKRWARRVGTKTKTDQKDTHRQAVNRENGTIRHGRDGLLGKKTNCDRPGRHTKTSTRQTKRTAHYKIWARWVPTTRKTGRLRQTSRHVTSRHQQGRFQLAANSPASNQASRRARLKV